MWKQHSLAYFVPTNADQTNSDTRTFGVEALGDPMFSEHYVHPFTMPTNKQGFFWQSRLVTGPKCLKTETFTGHSRYSLTIREEVLIYFVYFYNQEFLYYIELMLITPGAPDPSHGPETCR